MSWVPWDIFVWYIMKSVMKSYVPCDKVMYIELD